MSGSDRSRPVPAGRSIEHDAGVSEIIGAVLLIALVVAGGVMVGVAIFSQPIPNQVPKVQIVIGADENGTVTLVHNGGEALNPGQYRVYLNQTPWSQSFINNTSPAETTAWTVGNSLTLRGSDANLTENVTVEYMGSSGNVTITSVRSAKNDGTEGAGFGFFSALYEHLFGTGTSEGIVPLPVRQVTHYEPVGAYAWPANMSPQVNFTPAEGVAYIYEVSSNSDYATIENLPGDKIHFTDVNTINDALVNYGTVILVDGTYDCEGPIRCIQSNRILMAHNPGRALVPMHSGGYSDGYIKVSAPNVIIDGLNLYGTGGVMIVASSVSIRNVNVTSRELGYTPADPNEPPSNKAPINGMFFVWADGQNIDNVEFYNCTARECNTHGWNMNQNWNGQPYAISNTRFVNCRASYCGYGEAGDTWAGNSGNTVTADHASRSEWITGFDLHEWQDLIDCHVYNCFADNNWESGFHFEPGARYGDNGEDIGPRTRSENVTLDNCTSVNNGRSTYGSAFFLSGYYLSRNTTLTNCTSIGNENAGFYVHGGTNSQFINCKDTGSKKAGFFVIKGSSDITIENCTSRNNPKFALWAAFTENLQVTKFHQVNANTDGYQGTQSILGWYKDDSRYGLPVTDSNIEIISNTNTLPIINKDGSGNTYELIYDPTIS
ncbi:right-handed parallel beta-helix repeat-containing protein [Methanosphaerula subterraneus]|uniref:right-handed parallel beta-helix repeat-containing protein n=1 Tax=Methanosphaerula subterraneus TaxID=3350244 RepID=UPI003F83FDB7